MNIKKYLILLGFLIMGFGSQSQVLIALLLGDKLNSDGLEFGLEAGYNWSKVSGFETNKSLPAFNLGLYFDIRLKNQWYLYTGVLVKSTLGVDKLTTNDLDFLQIEAIEYEGDYSQKIKYFLVPALAKYKFKNHIYVEGGPQFGLMYDAWVEYNSDVEGTTARIRADNKDMINRLDAGIMGGFGYTLLRGMGISFGVKYYYGFANVYKDQSGTNNNSLFVKLCVPIGAEKKPKAKKDK